jgi:hypothetical protein
VSKFEGQIDAILERRNATIPASESGTWRDEIANRIGIDLKLIEELHNHLSNTEPAILTATELLARWFFAWLAAESWRVDAVVGHRMPADLRAEFEQADLFGGALADAVWGWMSGETLVTLNTRLGGNPMKPGPALKARKFVLRVIPDLAFASGLVTQIKRGQMDEGGDIAMPLALATFGLCVRDGVPSPEVAALRATNSAERWSRQKAISLWGDIEAFTEPRDNTESFGRTKTRVIEGLRAFREKET